MAKLFLLQTFSFSLFEFYETLNWLHFQNPQKALISVSACRHFSAAALSDHSFCSPRGPEKKRGGEDKKRRGREKTIRKRERRQQTPSASITIWTFTVTILLILALVRWNLANDWLISLSSALIRHCMWVCVWGEIEIEFGSMIC